MIGERFRRRKNLPELDYQDGKRELYEKLELTADGFLGNETHGLDVKPLINNHPFQAGKIISSRDGREYPLTVVNNGLGIISPDNSFYMSVRWNWEVVSYNIRTRWNGNRDPHMFAGKWYRFGYWYIQEKLGFPVQKIMGVWNQQGVNFQSFLLAKDQIIRTVAWMDESLAGTIAASSIEERNRLETVHDLTLPANLLDYRQPCTVWTAEQAACCGYSRVGAVDFVDEGYEVEYLKS